MRKILLVISLFVLWCCQDEDNVVCPDVQIGNFTDERDQTTYRCITIGNQVWMAENLRFQHDGGAFDGCWTWNEELPELNTKQFIKLEEDYWVEYLISDDLYFEIDELNQEGYSYEEIIDKVGDQLPKELLEEFYQTNPNGEFLKEFGYLYSYEAAVAAVPEGWRLPTDEDWQELEKTLGMSGKEISLMNQWRGNGQGDLLKSGDNGIGFDALMCGGKLFGTGEKVNIYSRQGVNAYFWSASAIAETDSTQIAVVRSVGMGESGILRFYSRTDGTAYSVRCVKNKED